MKMRTTIAAVAAALCITWVFASSPSADTAPAEVFVTIGGGDYSGVYFPAGLTLAKLLNAKRHLYGIRATVEATTGSIFNLEAVLAGYMTFGLAQSDKQFEAVHGLAEWAEKGPQEALRAVFSLHHEAVTLVAAVDAGIGAIEDLRGKRVSTGNPGPSQHRIVVDALAAVGIDADRDFFAQKVMASDAPILLQDNRIDAFFFTVGHPSAIIRSALAGERKVRLLPIAGPAIDRLIAENVAYTQTLIPVRRLYPAAEGAADVATIGVTATVCTTAKVPDDVVYALTREVFENLDRFRVQHPAFYGLTAETMLQGLSAPMHPGALKYFRESGLRR